MNLSISRSPLVLIPMQDTLIKIKVTPPQAAVILFPKAPISTKPKGCLALRLPLLLLQAALPCLLVFSLYLSSDSSPRLPKCFHPLADLFPLPNSKSQTTERDRWMSLFLQCSGPSAFLLSSSLLMLRCRLDPVIASRATAARCQHPSTSLRPALSALP